MNKLLALVILSVSTANAGLFPATVARDSMPAQLIDVRERTALEIKARAAAGYNYASVDMDGATWKTENIIMQELIALGYEVDYGNDHHVYGWNKLNGALVIRWGAKRLGPIFGK